MKVSGPKGFFLGMMVTKSLPLAEKKQPFSAHSQACYWFKYSDS
jgi:hypothetical protein